MKYGCAIALLFAAACLCNARPTRNWTYEELKAEADLIVIATATETKDQDKTVFPNLVQADAEGKRIPVPAIGMDTRFKVLGVLKGDEKLKELAVYHLREAKAENVPNGPRVASFDLKGQRRYLMFLKREADGRFVAVTGQVDSAIGVKDLGSYP
jgi:hypothetical protein